MLQPPKRLISEKAVSEITFLTLPPLKSGMKLLTTLFILTPFMVFAKSPAILSGPFQGHTTHSSTRIWFLAKNAEQLKYVITNTSDSMDFQTGLVEGDRDFMFKTQMPFKFDLDSLREASTYQLDIYHEKDLISSGKIKTIRNHDVDDFSFLIGSCAFIGSGKNRLLKIWNSTKIFRTLSEEEKGDFMLWMGDNLYLMGGEIKSRKKTIKRYNAIRQHKSLNRFMKKKFHYAIWDDHDFGPNNCDGNFLMKDKSKEVFENYWRNPEEPHPGGIYFSFKYADVEIFMLDDRYNSDCATDKRLMLGPVQMEWLKTGLSNSSASYKIVVSGSQVLNQYDNHESFMQCTEEKDELFGHIRTQEIDGIVFLSGDRHHSEILRKKEEGIYPFYDFTCSGLTSWRHPLRKLGQEGKNDLRVGELILKHNYAVVSISGTENARVFKITYKNKAGKVLQEFELKQHEVSF